MSTNDQEDIQKLNESVKALTASVEPLVKIIPKLEAIVEAYDSVIFGKKFLAGVAVVMTSIVAIGGGVIWFVNYIRHGN